MAGRIAAQLAGRMAEARVSFKITLSSDPAQPFRVCAAHRALLSRAPPHAHTRHGGRKVQVCTAVVASAGFTIHNDYVLVHTLMYA